MEFALFPGCVFELNSPLHLAGACNFGTHSNCTYMCHCQNNDRGCTDYNGDCGVNTNNLESYDQGCDDGSPEGFLWKGLWHGPGCQIGKQRTVNRLTESRMPSRAALHRYWDDNKPVHWCDILMAVFVLPGSHSSHTTHGHRVYSPGNVAYGREPIINGSAKESANVTVDGDLSPSSCVTISGLSQHTGWHWKLQLEQTTVVLAVTVYGMVDTHNGKPGPRNHSHQ